MYNIDTRRFCMKKFKLGLVALAIMAFAGIANASGVGYIDYAKVIDNYDYAKQVTKEVVYKTNAIWVFGFYNFADFFNCFHRK